MDSFFGVSKATFLDTHVVPANDNDVFNDGKCAFCKSKIASELIVLSFVERVLGLFRPLRARRQPRDIFKKINICGRAGSSILMLQSVLAT